MVDTPYQVFVATDGTALEGGSIYVGAPNADPEASPINLFWDAGLTIPAAQPLRTSGGIVTNAGAPAEVFAGRQDYSIRVRDRAGALVWYKSQAGGTNATRLTFPIAGGPQGDKGDPGGPLLDGTVVSSSISANGAEQTAIRTKIGAAATADLVPLTSAVGNIPYAPTATLNANLAPRPVLRPNRTVQDAILTGTVNITIVGDSIMEPAGIPYGDSVAENLQQMLSARMPWLTINVTNLSIPGRSMSNLANPSYTAPGSFTLAAPTGLNNSYWPGGSVSGKSWRDHVKDSAPDLIVLALGENDGTDELPLSINYQTVYEYSQTWAKKPWFALLASLIPEGSDNDRRGKQAVADFFRFKAIEQGFGLIDANSIYRLLRDGTRRDFVPFVSEPNLIGYGDSSKFSTTGSFTFASNVLTGSGRVERQVYARDIDLTDTFTLAGTDAVWASNFRSRSAGGYAVQSNFADGFTRLYYRGSLVATGAIPTKTTGQTARIRVKAWGPLIRVWHDNALVLSYSSAQGLFSGPFDIGTAAGSGAHASIVMSYAPEYAAASPFFSAAYLLNDVLHHPTGDGAFQTYIPATKQFADEFAELATRPMVASKGRFTTDATFPESGTQVLAETAVMFRTAGERLVPVRITFGYKNPFTAAATLTVRLDGTGVVTYPLAPTTGTENRAVTFNADVLIPAGQHTLDLTFTAALGTTTGNGVTSVGQFNDRQLSAWVEPA